MGCKMETMGQWLAAGQRARDGEDGLAGRQVQGENQSRGWRGYVCLHAFTQGGGISQRRDFQI